MTTVGDPLRDEWLTKQNAIDAYLDFEDTFGRGAAILACHAAFPFYLTSELVDLIRINFVTRPDVTWLTGPDFLLSPLCHSIGRGFYQVEPNAREVMLLDLIDQVEDGPARLRRLADFLLAYVERQPRLNEYSKVLLAYQWIAGAYLDPAWVVQDMNDALENARRLGGPVSRPDQQQVAAMLNMVRAPLDFHLAPSALQNLTENVDTLLVDWYQPKPSKGGQKKAKGTPPSRPKPTSPRDFKLYSPKATKVELCFFDHVDDPKPSHIFQLNSPTNPNDGFWQIFVPEVKDGQLYGYRVDGPYAPEKGLRFDPGKLLIDPYAHAVAFPPSYNRADAARRGYDNTATAIKSVVESSGGYDWQGDQPLRLPISQTVIYDMHLAGFTKHPNSGLNAQKRGTYAGLIEKIPYLQELGINTVELLPVMAFDPLDAPEGLVNYWGYSPVSYFAPHPFYSSRLDPLGPLDEFRDMIKALHLAGIQVILDVVFSHTAEGGEGGPTISFRGLDNEIYYLSGNQNSPYIDFSGAGNTLNSNHPVVRRMILDSLRFWVSEMHIDGFRFDLASLLTRDESGRPVSAPPVILEIEKDPVLSGTVLIAEPWDVGGLYQLGQFPGERWLEWNGRFQDDIRAWLKADSNSVSNLANRLLGSPDIFEKKNREAGISVNFVANHDGFTLNDSVSFNSKHNDANNQDNRDGSDNNLSWNHGLEGPSDDPDVEALRVRQIKNSLTYLFLSFGTPMLLMGDEVRRSQNGNNNAYCQDNEISWFDWDLVVRNTEVLRFTRELISLRHSSFSYLNMGRLTLSQALKRIGIEWHGIKLYRADFSKESRSLAVTFNTPDSHQRFHILFNTDWETVLFELPPLTQSSWLRLIDTGLPAPEDCMEMAKAPPVSGNSYNAMPRSVVVLVNQLDETQDTAHYEE